MGTTVYAATAFKGVLTYLSAAIKSLTFQKTRCLCSRKSRKKRRLLVFLLKRFFLELGVATLFIVTHRMLLSARLQRLPAMRREASDKNLKRSWLSSPPRVKKRGIPVLISNHDLPLTRSLYHGADFSMLSVKRSISQNGAKRQPVDEILAYFPPANVAPKRNTRKKKTFHRPSV